jgi:hypothetical protein
VGKVVQLGLLATTACGRLGFDPSDVVIPDPEPRIECGAPARFQVGAVSLREMVATPTSTGFAVFTVDAAKELHGWSFDWNDEDVLEVTTQNARIDVDVTGAFGATAIDGELLVAAVHGAAATLGTTYHPLDEALAPRATPVTTASRVIGVVPFAQNTDLAAIRFEANQVAVHGIDMSGVDGSMRVIGPATDAPSEPAIVKGHLGYAATWVAATPTPNNTQLVLLDEYYAIVKGPVAVTNTAGFDTIRPRVLWAPASNTYAVTWFEKTPTNDDDVYAQVFDAALSPRTPPTLIARSAVRPRLETDGNGFFVEDLRVDVVGNTMKVTYLAGDGTIAARTVGSSGGNPTAWAMVHRADQPVLVYAEAGASGPDLWFDAMCP